MEEVRTMTEAVLKISDGPDKPALQWAVVYPGREPVHFRIDEEPVDADIDEMTEHTDGWSFDLKGRLSSGPYKGIPFSGTYSVSSRSGSLTLAR